MKTRLVAAAVFATVLGAADPALAQPAAGELAGAWECRLQGRPATRTPPILWIAPAAASAQPAPESIEVDGFAGAVRGEGRLAAAAHGWSQFEGPDGNTLWLKSQAEGRRSTLIARLGRAGTSYRCLRLPQSAGRT